MSDEILPPARSSALATRCCVARCVVGGLHAGRREVEVLRRRHDARRGGQLLPEVERGVGVDAVPERVRPLEREHLERHGERYFLALRRV